MQSALLRHLPENAVARAAVLAGSGLATLAIGRKLYRYGQVLLQSLITGGEDRALYKRKRQLFQRLSDKAAELGRPIRALELGTGTGINFKYLPPGTEITALDPLTEAHGMYAKAAADAKVRLVACVGGSAEDLSRFEDESFDAVFCTLTMCTVSNLDRMLAEVRRVLRPGGVFLFIDHTLSDRPVARVVQYAMTPLWYFLFDGCKFRLPQKNVRRAGFSRCEISEFDGDLAPRFLLRPMIVGCAVK